MCCIVNPCAFSDSFAEDGCKYITINDDDTTTCHNEDAKAAFIGYGCVIHSSEEMEEIHWKTYGISVRTTKDKLRKRGQNAFNGDRTSNTNTAGMER